MSRVAIVGGGISGLSAAYYLGRHGIPCTLIEREQRLGGIVRTERFGDCLVEAGPDSWLAEKAWMLDLVRELGLGDQVMGSNDDRRRTYIVRRGRARPLPESMRLLAPSKPWQAATSGLFGLASKARMASEWFRRPRTLPERSVAEFVEDHFGREAVEYLAQPLLAPVSAELTTAQTATLEEYTELLAGYGFQLEPFGGEAWLVRAVPATLASTRNPDPARALINLLDAVAVEQVVMEREDALAATIACHGAVRAGHTLNHDEMDALLRQLETTDNPHNCPHGRPTVIHFTEYQLEREFGRR